MTKAKALHKYFLLAMPLFILAPSAMAYIGSHVGHRPGGSFYRHQHPHSSYGYHRYHRPYGYHYYHMGPYGRYNYSPYYGVRTYFYNKDHHNHGSFKYRYQMPQSIQVMNERQAELMNRLSNMNLHNQQNLMAIREDMLDARSEFARHYADYEYMLRNKSRKYIQLNRYDLERQMAAANYRFMELYDQFRQEYTDYKSR